jgi:hypothetical protein
VYVAGSEVEAVAKAATGEQPIGSMTGAGRPLTLLVTVNVCDAEPAPAKFSDDGETVIAAGVGGPGGPGVNEPPPPPPPPPHAASAHEAATTPTSERIRTAINRSFQASDDGKGVPAARPG